MKKSILFAPANSSVINQLRDNLKESLSKVFSFSPNSNEKLEAVALGTLGYYNGRQQWKAMAENDLHQADASIQSLVSGYNSPLEVLINHTDPQVQKIARGIKDSLEKSYVLVFDVSDFEDVFYTDTLTDDEKVSLLHEIRANYDNNLGVTNDTLAYAAEAFVESKVFLSTQYGAIKYKNYQWQTDDGTAFIIHSNYVDTPDGDGSVIKTWLSLEGESSSYLDGLCSDVHGKWLPASE